MTCLCKRNDFNRLTILVRMSPGKAMSIGAEGEFSVLCAYYCWKHKTAVYSNETQNIPVFVHTEEKQNLGLRRRKRQTNAT